MLAKLLFPALAVALLAASPAAEAQSASELLEKGIYTEETVGDLDAAMKIYRQIVADAQANRPHVARAQYRLGMCYLKKGQKEKAAGAFQKLIKEFPDQTELVAKAKKHVPGKPELKLDPAPWKDGEYLQLAVKLGGGLKIGTFVWSVDSAKVDGKDIWRMQTHRYILAGGDNKGVSRVDAGRETFRPVRSVWRHTLLGDVDADYAPGEVTITSYKNGEESIRKAELTGTVYDNEQGMHLFRRLPLAKGYKTTVPIYVTFGGGKVDIPLAVTAKETVEVPAGKFECHKLELGIVNQTFWISADADRYLVKLEGGGVMAELTAVGRNKPGKPNKYQDDQRGFSLAAPTGWYFYGQPIPDKPSMTLICILDPEAAATSMLRLWKLEDLKANEKASARAWAESDIVKQKEKRKGFQVRPDSWQQRKVAGRPAVSMLADYLQGEQKMVAYCTYVLGESIALRFGTGCKPEQFDDFRKRFDKIIDTCQMKQK